MYIDYVSALEMCSLSTLKDRREIRCTKFCQAAAKHTKHMNMFPLSENYVTNTHGIRNPEKYVVNFSAGEKYRVSTIPFLQRRLNEIHKKQEQQSFS